MYKGKLIVRFDDTNPSKEKVRLVSHTNRQLMICCCRGSLRIRF
jgi:glutamyl/glutaminyl-tRNA synthetase